MILCSRNNTPPMSSTSIVGNEGALFTCHQHTTLLAVSTLQKKGVEVNYTPFKAHAKCKDLSSRQVLWVFELAKNGLYVATLAYQKMMQHYVLSLLPIIRTLSASIILPSSSIAR